MSIATEKIVALTDEIEEMTAFRRFLEDVRDRVDLTGLTIADVEIDEFGDGRMMHLTVMTTRERAFATVRAAIGDSEGTPSANFGIPADPPVEVAGAEAEPEADPAPEPEPVAEPAPLSDATEAPKPDVPLIAASAPLSDGERTVVVRMIGEGAASGAIAAALGRDPRGFYHQVDRIARDLEKVAFAAALDTGCVNLAPAPPLGASLGLSVAERAVHQRLDRLGNPGLWTVEADLELLEGLARGAKLGVVAREIEIDVDACKARVAALVPHPSPEEQAQVLKALRQRAGA